jgi:SpoVK/Ycf46/Vps4 family AAA+-type ATPase
MGNFKLKNKTTLKDIYEGKVDTIPESDLALQDQGYVLQFDYVKEEKEQKPIVIKPGSYNLNKTSTAVELAPMEFVERELLTTVTNTAMILNEADMFFNNLSVYEELGQPKKRGVLLYGLPGCHAKNQGILMHDGSIKLVQDIVVGDKLMGPDSQPREVLKLVRGRQEMVKVIPTKGDSFIVNKGHILSLVHSVKNQIFNIEINNIISKHDEKLKLYKVGVEFKEQNLEINPYVLGLWLGDGSSNLAAITTMDNEIKQEWYDYANVVGHDVRVQTQLNNKSSTYTITARNGGPKVGKNRAFNALKALNLIKNKHIPVKYLRSSRQQRLELLAGIIDTDGNLNKGRFDYVSVNKQLANDVVYLSRSLGLAAYIKSCKKKSQNGTEGTYWRVAILGDIDMIPSRLKRKKAEKRKQIKNVLRNGFKLELLPEDDYYGFTVDKDHLYLMEDFTVTHNCGKTCSIMQAAKDIKDKDPGTVVINWPTSEIDASTVFKFFTKYSEYTPEATKLILVIEDIGGSSHEGYSRRDEVSSSLLNLLDGINNVFKIPTMIISTTNHPENLMASLAQRPGRFDMMLEIEPPSQKERLSLVEFIAKRKLTKEEKDALDEKNNPGVNSFSIAHLQEIVIRSRLHSKSISLVVKELLDHATRFKLDFAKPKKGSGFALFED